jgi:HTH-type transcriptional regulator/antitoxin HigA
MREAKMNITPIKTEKDYEFALKEIERLFSAKPNTPAGDKLDILTTLVHSYEDEHYPVDFPDAVEALKYWIESRGLQRKDLQEFIGSRARISEILNRKRNLTLNMIRKLHDELHIPAELLIKKSKSTVIKSQKIVR